MTDQPQLLHLSRTLSQFFELLLVRLLLENEKTRTQGFDSHTT